MIRLSQTPPRSPGWPRRILIKLGRAMGATIQLLDKAAALDAAVHIHRPPPPDGWAYADAVLVHDVWLVVLEQSASAHIVEVNAYTGAARTLASSVRPRCTARYRRPHRTVLTSCTGWRGDPTVVSIRHRGVRCGNGSRPRR